VRKGTKFQIRSDAARQRWVRDERKEAYWRARISDWKKSGKTKRAYCLENNLSQSSFNAWNREIAIRDREKVPSTNAQELLAQSQIINPFVPLRLLPETDEPAEGKCSSTAQLNPTSLVEILVPGGAIIRLHDCGLSSIGEIFSALKS
jgi:hypothetical protein